jgi:hypothetical protein
VAKVALGELHAERFVGDQANAEEEFAGDYVPTVDVLDTGDATSAVEI